MAKISGTPPRIPASKTEVAKAPARTEPKPVARDPKVAVQTGWSSPTRPSPAVERAAIPTVHPRLAHAQPELDPIFGAPSRPTVTPRTSLPLPHPRQGHETSPRVAVPTQPRPGVSTK